MGVSIYIYRERFGDVDKYTHTYICIGMHMYMHIYMYTCIYASVDKCRDRRDDLYIYICRYMGALICFDGRAYS